MKSSQKDKKSNEVGVELKYCEHCGGLWVRERGTGVVYCEKCQPKVADLPSPKMRSNQLILPVHPPTAIEDCAFEIDIDESNDFEAAGGVA